MNFAELVALMVLGGDQPDSLVGVVRHSSPEDGEWSHRVYRRGRLSRRESLDGRVLRIRGADYEWVRYQGDDEFTAFPHDGRHLFASPIGGLEPGGARPSFSRWDGPDFTRPSGPVSEATFLGRDCWRVELAPPSHKPYPIQVTVDAGTGLVLRDANRDFGSVTEFTEVEIGVDLPAELFVWAGPARAPRDHDAEHEADLAERRAWLDAHGVVLELPIRPDLRLHERDDDTGAFELSFHTSVSGALTRRPAPDPAPDDGMNYPSVYRWTDSRWAWVLSTTAPIAEEQLALLKVQLAKST